MLGQAGQWVPVSGTRRRALLAVLLLNAGQVVSYSQLIGELWPEGPPHAPSNALHAQVVRLRDSLNRHLGPGQGKQRIAMTDQGYALHLEPGELDLAVFESLRGQASDLAASDPRSAIDKLGQALALWRDIPFGDPPEEHGPQLYAAAVRLEEHRLLATEDLVDLRLTAGDHRLLIGELKALVARYPLRERFCEQLIVALGRSGRRAEAVEAFRATRKYMIAELGLEPSSALYQRLQEILNDTQGRSA
ncbi:AfsR/SARP family transcriptional regulator [Haloechinothrix sp. LS1_15]|nr:AfsR/SARP family transcriptional regulator [Haloechinothrix sp. LS1_15]